MSTEAGVLMIVLTTLIGIWVNQAFSGLPGWLLSLAIIGVASSVLVAGALLLDWKSSSSRERRKLFKAVEEVPQSLKAYTGDAVKLGAEVDLQLPIYLPNAVRLRHVHILGATGSGKTESVVLNFLRQDIRNGFGAIILDAKGDNSFKSFLLGEVAKEKLHIFDLSSAESEGYDPLCAGSAMEASQRLFSALNWSEEYYQSKAISALQRIFGRVHAQHGRNPTLAEVAQILESQKAYGDAVASKESYPLTLANSDFSDLSGLRDQVNLLCSEHLRSTLSPEAGKGISLAAAGAGSVVYFRLQSLLSPRLATSVGRLVIAHLGYLAGSAHRQDRVGAAAFIPTYLDEFASFASREFADLISKARSAGIALHFSHQSLGDIESVQPGFMGRINDNSATKIVLRVNDPETAETMARTFGTMESQQITKRVKNAEDSELAEVEGAGSLRETRQFRASPDLLKTLPTGVGAVLVAHGLDCPGGGSSVFKIKFPRLESNRKQKGVFE